MTSTFCNASTMCKPVAHVLAADGERKARVRIEFGDTHVMMGVDDALALRRELDRAFVELALETKSATAATVAG